MPINSDYHKSYHHTRTAEAKARKLEKQRLRVANIIKTLRELKSKASCKDCGESDPLVLDFDHREKENKKFTIGNVARQGWSLKKIQLEIDKCDVVCANCHRRRTAKQLNWTL